MPEKSGITPADIEDWESLEITRMFFEDVRLILEDADIQVHRSLELNQKEEAALFNAGMTQVQEILEIPGRMKEDAKDAT